MPVLDPKFTVRDVFQFERAILAGDREVRMLENRDVSLHPWMKGYIAVFQHPYFAITGKDGTFELKNVPHGEFRIEDWHEKYGWLTQESNLETKKRKIEVSEKR